MLELLGKGYVIEYCISFFNKKQEERAYRYYLTDAIRMLTYNTTQKWSGIMEQRFIDLISGLRQKKKEKEKTPEEIINHISDKLRKS